MLFLGSNIGNFDPPAGARAAARASAARCAPGDALLLGTDLVKPERDLLLAYDDPLQVTAAFNRNLLRRINDELGGTFDLDGFAHRAVWNAGESRVEMHLVSRGGSACAIAAADLEMRLRGRASRSGPRAPTSTEPDEIARRGPCRRFRTRRAMDRRGGALRPDQIQRVNRG